jgi:DNA-binding GntR family transcriptional regulator
VLISGIPKGRTVPVPSPDHQAVERRSLREIAVEKIKAAIFDHTLEPGENLKDEDLQAWLGMSRTPVREALTELKRLGLVDMEAQRFTRVATPDPDPIAALQDLQTVGALLCGVARLTVPVLGTAATTRIVKALSGIDDAIAKGDGAEYASRVRRLTQLLVENCPNPALIEATSDLVEAKLYTLSFAGIELSRDTAELRTDYRSLRGAVEARDGVAADLAIGRAFQLDTSA